MTWLSDFVDAASQSLPGAVVESLNARGVSDEQIALYKIGFIHKALPVDVPKEFTEWAVQGRKLEHCYVFPLTNTIGEVRGLQFRSVERGVAGYRNFISDTGEAVHFGLAQAMPTIWKTRVALPVEGVFDVCPIQRHFGGTFATLTARVPEPLMRTLRRTCDSVILGWDNDETGRDAARRFIKDHGHEFQTRHLVYPRISIVGATSFTKDPGDLWESWGDAELGKWLRTQLSTEISNA